MLAVCLSAPVTISAQANLPDAAAAGQPKNLATIDGHVVNAISGEPVRRTTVTLLSQGTGRNAVVSDGQGAFRFEGVDPGVYTLSAERAGFLRQEYGSRRPASPGPPIVVAPGQRLNEVDFKLTPQGVITGRVLDEEGEPIESATVQVLRHAGRRLLKIDDTETNDLGAFRIAGLSPGSYILAAVPPVPRSAPSPPTPPGEQEFVPGFYPGVTDLPAAVPVQLAAGQEAAGLDFQLRKARVYRVRGRAAGSGANRSVQLLLLPRDRAEAVTDFSRLSATTRPDGSFEIGGVQAGSYDLVAIRTEMGQQILGRLPIEVSNSNVDGVTFPVGDGLEVTGTVRIDGERKASLNRTLVLLLPSLGPPLMPLTGPVREDASFRIEGVARDLYRLHFLRLPEGTYVKSVRLGGQEVLDKWLDLSRAATPTLEISLSTKGGTVEGLVAADGEPAGANEVSLVPEPGRPNQPYLYKRATVDRQGHFRITGVAPGDYVVNVGEATAASGADPEPGDPVEGQGEKISVQEGGREQMQLKMPKTREAGT